MTEEKKKKRYFAKHAKSSAMVVSLAIHGILILIAVSFVAVTVIQKEEQSFEAKKVKRPKQPLKKLKVPVKVKKAKPKPKLRKQVVVKNLRRKTPDFKMPEIRGFTGGIGAMGDGGGMEAIGFTMPELDFFGAKAKGEKVVFVVHFGPATINEGGVGNPYTRMTGLTIRNRLKDLVEGLPEYALFNVACFWVGDTWAMSPEMLLATSENKKKVVDWMEPVNPLEGNYDHCFKNAPESVGPAARNYPTRIDQGLTYFAPKWIYPYVVPKAEEAKYLPDAQNGFQHWSRGVAWAILEQKADTVFVLTTNYIDGWGSGQNGQPSKMAGSLKNMFTDIYGPDRKKWPTVNVVVLAKVGRNSENADNVLNNQFGPIWKGSKGDGSVIDDITKFMTEEEKDMMRKYRSEYGQPSGGRNNR